MYFESRRQAGAMLAQELVNTYRYEDCVVVALNDSSILVGEEIARSLHCVLTMLLIDDIEVPGESMSFGGVSQSGSFTYNSHFSAGEIDEYTSEFHGYLDEKKRESFQKINRLIGDGGIVDEAMLQDHVVILVLDGIDDGAAVDVAMDFLKPIRARKVVFATPLASIPAVDRLHTQVDELHILDVRENFMGIDHYYDNNEIPSHETAVQIINQTILNWQ